MKAIIELISVSLSKLNGNSRNLPIQIGQQSAVLLNKFNRAGHSSITRYVVPVRVRVFRCCSKKKDRKRKEEVCFLRCRNIRKLIQFEIVFMALFFIISWFD